MNPVCPVFRRCGGCALLDMDYAAQLEAKRRRLEALLGGLMITGVEYAFGLIFNRRHQIWDYRRMPANLRGQICLPFTLAWCGLSALALGSMRVLRS